jgi:hypothetical protein
MQPRTTMIVRGSCVAGEGRVVANCDRLRGDLVGMLFLDLDTCHKLLIKNIFVATVAEPGALRIASTTRVTDSPMVH